MPERHRLKPCWTPEAVATVVTTIAKMDAERSNHFLASHSPINGILDERKQAPYDEETLFKEIFDPSRAETLAVLWGEPGAGKSHLIHWLKLRTDYGVKKGDLTGILTVLVQRRSGNLKDALQQLVQQLPPEFMKYMDPVRQALDRISDTTARELLVNALSIELLPERRQERGLAPLDPRLAKLRELCHSPGTRAWLCRPEGVIDSEIRRLTGTERQASVKEVRFDASEFTAIRPQFLRDNSDSARVMLDDIEFEGIDLARSAADAFNETLPFAVRELSGLGGTTLREIFDAIRKDLAAANKFLALFVEDVSVMSAIDADVLRAVEPQSNPQLCRMVAVLGMTDAGKERLHPNELGRINILVEMRRSVEEWRDSEDAVASFAARYLNTVRLSDTDVGKVAGHRLTGRDVNISKCTKCPEKDTCLPLFGSVEFDGVTVGLFPFRKPTARKLLSALDVRRGGIRQNQRGFLDQVLRPALNNEQHENGTFPNPAMFSVRLDEPLNWAPLIDRFCRTWSEGDKARLRFLAQAWIGDGEGGDHASRLAPFLGPLGFPDFSAAVVEKPGKRSVKQPDRPPDRPPVEPVERPRPPKASTPREFTDIQNALAAWAADSDTVLESDVPIRDLLLRFVKNSLFLEHDADPPVGEFKRLVDKRNNVFVEGQKSKPAAVTFELRFDRNSETRDLIQALAYHKYVGSDSWEFEHGQHYQRIVSTWLRRHRAAFLERFRPRGLDRWLPVRATVSLLCLAAVVRRRKALPPDPIEALAEIFAPFDVEPEVLVPRSDWDKRLKALRQSHDELRRFVLAELEVAQGSTGEEPNFIDPEPALGRIAEFTQTYTTDAVPPTYSTGHWKARYAALDTCEYFVDLPSLLAPERAELKRLLQTVHRIVDSQGEDIPEAVRTYLKEIAELVRTLRANQLPVPDRAFEAVQPLLAQTAEHADEVGSAIRVDSETGVEPLLTFAPKRFTDVAVVLSTCDAYVTKVEAEVQRTEQHIVAQGDPDTLLESLLSGLESLATRPVEENAT